MPYWNWMGSAIYCPEVLLLCWALDENFRPGGNNHRLHITCNFYYHNTSVRYCDMHLNSNDSKLSSPKHKVMILFNATLWLFFRIQMFWSSPAPGVCIWLLRVSTQAQLLTSSNDWLLIWHSIIKWPAMLNVCFLVFLVMIFQQGIVLVFTSLSHNP